MKIYVLQIRRFISIDGYYTHFLIFRINLGYIENVNIANGKWQQQQRAWQWIAENNKSPSIPLATYMLPLLLLWISAEREHGKCII
jgi:hypothetical protein